MKSNIAKDKVKFKKHSKVQNKLENWGKKGGGRGTENNKIVHLNPTIKIILTD